LRARVDEASSPMARVEVMEIITSPIHQVSSLMKYREAKEEEKRMLPVYM
jgi:hypothetical protein